MPTVRFWLRWSWRDLRAQWLQVTVVALIIALGTAIYVGLGSTTPRRLHAADASYARLNTYDLHVTLAPGSYLNASALVNAVGRIEHRGWIAAAEPRLAVPTLVRTHNDDGEIVVRGQIMGMDVSDGGPHVNRIHVNTGRALTSADDGQPVGILEYHFADYYHLPSQGSLELSGGATLTYVGTGMIPDYMMVVAEENSIWVQAAYAVVYLPLGTAQTLTGFESKANDLVIRLNEGVPLEAARTEVEQALHAAFPGVGIELRTRDEHYIYRLVYKTIRSNQQIYDFMTVLFMAGATFGAFTLASRIVEAQRRQIGIGMALGVPPRLLMVRPLLVGAQIAVLGALFGVVFGLIMGKLTEQWIGSIIPMPVTGRLLQTDIFLRGAALGFVLPFAATIFPVWRAVRVLPIDAIRTGHLVAKGNGLAARLSFLPVPGRSFVQMPVRNLVRAPRRTVLTVLGIAAAITTLVGMAGTVDSTMRSVVRIRQEYYQDHPDRMTVFFDDFYPLDASPVQALRSSLLLSAVEPGLRFPSRVARGGREFDIIVEVLDLENDLWTPTLVEGRLLPDPEVPGAVIARSAALDLKAKVGDTITLRLPRPSGELAFETVAVQVQVTGLHADPWRSMVYMDYRQASLMNLAGRANIAHVNPAPGVKPAEVKNALFDIPGVTTVLPVRSLVESIDWILKEIILFLSGVELGVFALAFLIAFNSTTINLSERAREVATMFAFGLPVRTAARMAMLENLLMGLLGTLVGFGVGVLTLQWFLHSLLHDLMPEIRHDMALSGTTIGAALVVGIVVVALTPLATMRRMARMDIPSTLRVME